MKNALRILAVLIALAAAGYWLAAGANRGWTKDKVVHESVDEVTGIVGRTEEEKFVPGVDVLSVGLGAAALLAGASFLFRNKQT